jgi:hypothetical protein
LKKRKKVFFFNLYTKKINIRKWVRLKKHYKEGLILKRFFQRFLDLSISSKKIKATRLKFKNLEFDKNSSANFIISYFFRLDIFLSKIGLFNSVYETINAIRNKLVYVNYKITTNNLYYLRCGDIIILKNFLSLKKERKEFNFFNCFFEADYYLNTIIIMKSLNSLSKKDFSLTIKEPMNLNKFFDYINKK